jgi:hypothetical protein
MAKNANPIIHELAVVLASQGKTKPADIKKFYGNYLAAVKTLTELDADEKFKANPLPKSKHKSTAHAHMPRK